MTLISITPNQKISANYSIKSPGPIRTVIQLGRNVMSVGRAGFGSGGCTLDGGDVDEVGYCYEDIISTMSYKYYQELQYMVLATEMI